MTPIETVREIIDMRARGVPWREISITSHHDAIKVACVNAKRLFTAEADGMIYPSIDDRIILLSRERKTAKDIAIELTIPLARVVAIRNRARAFGFLEGNPDA